MVVALQASPRGAPRSALDSTSAEEGRKKLKVLQRMLRRSRQKLDRGVSRRLSLFASRLHRHVPVLSAHPVLMADRIWV